LFWSITITQNWISFCVSVVDIGATTGVIDTGGIFAVSTTPAIPVTKFTASE
jgi:hypothetical protein